MNINTTIPRTTKINWLVSLLWSEVEEKNDPKYPKNPKIENKIIMSSPKTNFLSFIYVLTPEQLFSLNSDFNSYMISPLHISQHISFNPSFFSFIFNFLLIQVPIHSLWTYCKLPVHLQGDIRLSDDSLEKIPEDRQILHEFEIWAYRSLSFNYFWVLFGKGWFYWSFCILLKIYNKIMRRNCILLHLENFQVRSN